MVPRNIIKLTKHIFSKYLVIKFSSSYSRNVIPRNKFDNLETNTPLIIVNLSENGVVKTSRTHS